MDILRRVREAEADGCNDEVGMTSDGRRLCDICMARPSKDVLTCSSHQFCEDCRSRFPHSRGCPICGSLRIREMEKETGKPYVTVSTYIPFKLNSLQSSSMVDSDDGDESIARSIQHYKSQRSASLFSDETVLSDSDSDEDGITHSIQFYANQPPLAPFAGVSFVPTPVDLSFAATPVERVWSTPSTCFSPLFI